MSGERSRPNFVAQKKYEAIEYWDREAKGRIKEGKYLRGFGNWAMMQLAKAHSESWVGLALDVVPIGGIVKGTSLAVKGVVKGAQAIKGAKAVKSANTIVEIDRSLRPVREAYGLKRPLAKTSDQVLSGVGKAAETIEGIAPKYIAPVTLGGTKIASPRSLLKASSLITRGIKTEVGLKQAKEVRKPGTTASVQPSTKRIFPPTIMTPSRPSKPFDINRLQQPKLSAQAQQEIMKKGIYVPGVWGTEVGRSRSGFDINKLKQPPLSKSLEREIMQKGVYVPGVWGMEITRSRPTPNPLRKMVMR